MFGEEKKNGSAAHDVNLYTTSASTRPPTTVRLELTTATSIVEEAPLDEPYESSPRNAFKQRKV